MVAQGDLFDRGFASAPMVEDAIIQLTDDQGDVVVEALGTRSIRCSSMRTTWTDVAPAPHESQIDRSLGMTRNVKPSLTLQLLPSPKVVTVDTQPRRDHDVPVRYSDEQRVA